MPEQETTPQQRESRPRTAWEAGKDMNAFFPQEAEEGEESPGEEQQEEQELEAEGVPEEGMAPEDEAEQDEASSGDEDADLEGEETSEDEPFMVLTVDGQEIPVSSKEEAIPLAQKGMHYTQEMQKLREQQRQWESKQQEMAQGLREKEGQYETALRTLHDTYGYVLGEDEPDWASEEMQRLKAEKPQEYVHIREQWDQLGAIRSELDRLARERQEEQQEQWQGWVSEQQTKLADKRPEWTDPAKRQQDYSLIRDYATSQGITEEEISNLYDHRFWMILHDAARYKKAEAVGKTKREEVKSKTAEPGSGKNMNQGNRRLRSERERLKKTGDVRSAGNIFQELMTREK